MLTGRSLVVGWILLPLLAGCAPGMENVRIDLPSYVPQSGQRAGASAKVRIAAVKDARTDAVGAMIGERTTIGNVSMGSIELNPPPADVIAGLLRTELTQMGHTLVDSGERYAVSARVRRFEVVTPATVVYWDINGTIELELEVAREGGTVHGARYAATCTDRTYIYPSEELIKKVVGICVAKIGAELQQDTTLARFMGG